MKLFRRPSGDHFVEHQKNNKNSNSHHPPMGQFSSSEVQAASAVAGKAVLSSASAIGSAENVGEMRRHGPSMAMGGVKQERAHSLASAPFRPSQPIDILGKARHRSSEVVVVHHYGKWPMPMPQQNQKIQQHHQPRVIQPTRRLNNGIPSAATSLGPMHRGNGREDLGRERIWQEAMRRRLLSLDSRPLDPECPSVSGDNNKENDQQKLKCGKQLSRSRKRLNSAELEYNGNGEREEELSELKQMESTGKQQEEEQQQKLQLRNASDSNFNQERGKPEGSTMIGRKSAGRIAYLYGVYGQQERAPYSQLLFTPQTQMMEDDAQTNILGTNGGGWMDCCWEDDRQKQHPHLCSDSEDECLELDGELEDEPVERLARLHSVSDIIGYAKVVRAQRQETLCRLDDVMSQFDALIRSYSMAMKSSQQNVENAKMNEMSQQPTSLTAAIVQSKAITN